MSSASVRYASPISSSSNHILQEGADGCQAWFRARGIGEKAVEEGAFSSAIHLRHDLWLESMLCPASVNLIRPKSPFVVKQCSRFLRSHAFRLRLPLPKVQHN